MNALVRICAVVLLLTSFAAAPAHGQEVNPAFRADIEKLLQVTGADKLGLQMANMAAGSVIDAMRRSSPTNVPDRMVEVIKNVLSTEFSAAFQPGSDMMEKIIALYAKHFTQDEVRSLVEFYNTPLGQKAIKEMPTLAQEGAVIGQGWANANMQRITGRLQERLRAEGFIP
jgi:hypothetical protein